MNGEYIVEKFGDTKPEAELRQADVYLQLNNKTLPFSNKQQTWDSLVEKYEVYLKGCNFRTKTISDKKNTLNCFKETCGPLSSTQISRQSIDKFKVARQETVKPVSVNHDLQILRAFLNWAHENGLIPRAIKITKLSVPDSDPFVLDDKSVKSLLKKAEEYPALKLMIQIALSTGLRRSDIQKIAESDIDRKAKILTASLRKVGVTVRIPISQELIQAIDNHIYQFVPKKWELIFHETRLPVNKDYPFPDKDWNQIRIDAGLGKAGNDAEWGTDFKALRATAFTNMAEQGVPVEVVQKIAGHKSIATTMKYYMKIRESRLQKAGKIANAKKWFAPITE